MRVGAAVMLGALAFSCGHYSLEARLVNDAVLKYDPESYRDDAAVALYAEDGVLLTYRRSGDSFTQKLTHRVWAVQSEEAFDLADVKIAMHAKDKLVALKARHIKPDGTVVEILPQQVIVDETSGDPEKGIAGRLFRFGDVQRGSVLEWSYVVELPYLDIDDESDSFGEYPVRHYEAWLEGSKEIILEGRFYNVPGTPQAGAGHDEAFRRIGVAADNLPAKPKREAFAPDWTFTQPRWAYRMLRWNFSGRATPVLDTWNDVISRWARRAWGADKEPLFAGFDQRADVSGCADTRCKLTRALTLLDGQLDYSGWGTMRSVRKATEVWQSKEASAFERAVLLRWLLDRAGVDASLAAYTARFTGQVDPNFPQTERFNRILVRVPDEGGPLWVDPSCRACELGQVSDEAAGADTLVFHARVMPMMEPDITSERATVTAKALAPPERVTVHEATLLPSGDVMLESNVERQRRFAWARCAELRSESPASRQDHARRQALALSPTAKVVKLGDPRCDLAAAKTSEARRVRLPQHALVDPQRIAVPLTLLDPDYLGTFDEEKRTQPIVFSNGAWRIQQRLHITAPPGYKLAAPVHETSKAPDMIADFVITQAADGGADVTLTVDHTAGLHEPAEYRAYRLTGEFLRGARMRIVELVKR